MPGKINPIMAEMMGMVFQKVICSAARVTEASNGAQLEINVFTPLIAYELMFSIQILSNGSNLFADRCIKGIKANKENISRYVEMDMSLATALSPHIGYEKASQIARKAYKENKSVKQVCLDMKILDKKTLDKILDPRHEVGKI